MTQSFAAAMPASANGLAMGHRSWFGFPVPYEEPFSRANLPSGFISPAPATWPATWPRISTAGAATGPCEERLGVVILSNTHDLPAIGRFNGIAAGVINVLTGIRQPVSARIYDSLLIRGVVVGIVTLQLAGMIASVRRRWRRRPDRVPSGWPGYVMHVVLPLLLNLLWAAYVLIRLPRVFAPLPVLTTMIPDLGFLLVGSGLVALAWAVARTVWYHPALIRVPAPHQV